MSPLSLFSGVHELRLKRPAGIAVGYFDSWEAALQAVENEPSQYIAAWFSLNPLKIPAGIALNPSVLSPAQHVASDSDVERRIWLLVDLDAPRPEKDYNATEAEKQEAREQAEKVREWLRSHGWPEPTLCDSGNGYHLLYRIELANDEASAALLKDFLGALKQRFPLVDSGNYNASRVCKLYSSWARKGPHSEERPHRRSGIVETGSDSAVTAEQLRLLCPSPARNVVEAGNSKLATLVAFLEYYAVPCRSNPVQRGSVWQIEIECLWSAEHGSETRRDTVASFSPAYGFGFKCLHSGGHCLERHWQDFRGEVERRNPQLEPFFKRLPMMTHSDIARDFSATCDDFVCVYDMKNEPTAAWMPGVRWTIGDDRNRLLRQAIRRHLDQLFDRYVVQAKEAADKETDSKKRIAIYKEYHADALKLRGSNFLNGVLSEIFLPPMSAYCFDVDESILPLPNGLVADLRTGKLREMLREDCQSKRLRIMPENLPTPLFDKFLFDIMDGDAEMVAFLWRICAAAITGHSFHDLIFFYGRGRNGKGALLRLLDYILNGEQGYAAAITPKHLEYGADDKRLNGRLCGMRLAYTGESISKLDWTRLKTLSGGDKLVGAKLYCDEASFTPSHTLILTTNDEPKLPPTDALKGRLKVVPFEVSFLGREDLTLETAMQREAPGILWKLIQLAPSVLEGGIQPTAKVTQASDDVLSANDPAESFFDERLDRAEGAFTPYTDMLEAVREMHRTEVGQEDNEERIMAGLRSKFKTVRQYVDGKQVRGFLDVKIRPKPPKP